MHELLRILIVGIIYLGALFYLLFLVRVSILAYRTTKWPTTEGEIVASKMREMAHTATASPVKRYRAFVGYTYAVKGQMFKSDAISAFERLNTQKLWSRKNAKLISSKYPLGERVIVYYDPDRPSRAVLEPGVDTNLLLTLLVTLLIVLTFTGWLALMP
mgnify:CR=1 FL=1